MSVSVGVVYAFDVSPAIDDPPDDTVYHRYCPADPPEALNVNAALPHDEFPVVVGDVGMVLIVATTAVRELSQTPLLIET